MERIHELIEELAKEITERFPGMTHANVRIDSDGYRYLSVDKCDKSSNLPFDKKLRRQLWEQYRNEAGTWSKDRSNEQNAYYEEKKVLLKE